MAKNQRGSEALHPPRHRKLARWAAAPLTLARRGLPAVIALLAAVSVAFAAEPNHSGASEAIFFGALAILLLVGRGLGEIMQKLGQPAVMGQLLGGVLLGLRCLAFCGPVLSTRCFRKPSSSRA